MRARRRSLRDWRGGAAAARGQWRRGHVTHPAPRAARTPTPCLQIIIIIPLAPLPQPLRRLRATSYGQLSLAFGGIRFERISLATLRSVYVRTIRVLSIVTQPRSFLNKIKRSEYAATIHVTTIQLVLRKLLKFTAVMQFHKGVI